MILYYWIAAIGMCWIMKYGSILESFRAYTASVFAPLAKLYKCCLCMGFWAGILLIPFLVIDGNWDIEVILFPFTCSAVCWIADSYITYIHNKSFYYDSLSSSSNSEKPSK